MVIDFKNINLTATLSCPKEIYLYH